VLIQLTLEYLQVVENVFQVRESIFHRAGYLSMFFNPFRD